MYSERGRYVINIYIARLIIEHPREWFAPLADYSKYSYSNLINVHEMIDNFSGVDTEFFALGGEGEHYGFCHRRHAVMNL